MLTKKEKELIAYLDKKNRWITSDELAEYSNCTTRTIRNRVAKILSLIHISEPTRRSYIS
uniref:helix-turn-helix domain-containing protein n=1 Tax=uncultured Enterococcus sp. TaxID=167972 RepID=UPI0025858C70